MSRSHQYIMLVTSLPHLGKMFTRKEVPISEFRLKQRLTMLQPEHSHLLRELMEVTAWAGVARHNRDSEVLDSARNAIAHLKAYPDLQNLVGARMETRTVIAALRRRREGQDSAGDIENWGFGRWCGRIAKHWSDPGLGLGNFMPWVVEAHRLMQSGDHIAMERLSLTQIFRQLDQYGMLHEFDFEAVAIYVLRWVIVERWSRYSEDAARERLQLLVTAALGGSSPPDEAAADEPPPGQGLFADSSSALQGATS